MWSLSEGFDLTGLGHLKPSRSRIIGSSFSYDLVRGVRMSSGRRSSCPLLDDLRWLGALKLLVVSPLAAWPATRTYCVAARTSSSSMEYLLARRNKLSMDVGGFLARDSKKGVPRHMLRLKIWWTVFMLYDSTCRTACPKRFTNSLNVSFSCILMFCKVLIFCLCLAKLKYCPTRTSDRSRKLSIEFAGSR